MDEASYYSYIFFSSYKNRDKIKQYMKGSYPYSGSKTLVEFSQIKDAYILIDWDVLNHIPKNYGWVLPEEIKNPPRNWKLVHEIKNPKGDALIYYAPS